MSDFNDGLHKKLSEIVSDLQSKATVMMEKNGWNEYEDFKNGYIWKEDIFYSDGVITLTIKRVKKE